MKKSRTLAPSKYLRKYGKAKISHPMITKEEVEAVLECAITDERYEELLEASRLYSLSNSDKHVNLAQDAEHRQDWEGAKKHWKNAALASIKHDTIHKTQRSDKLKVRGITMRKEEVEQIDEKDTQNKRIAKAYVRATGTPSEDGPADDADGDSQAQYRASREPGYDADSFDHHVRKQAGRHLGKDDPENRRKRYIKNDKHYGKYAKKTYKEEVEPLTELSTEKKAQYIKRSKQSRDYHDVHVDHYSKGGRSTKAFAHHLKKGDKRTVGMLKAKMSIAKKDGSYSEAVELSASRKTKVNALLAKHQAKGLPTKPSKKYTREYTGDGLPLIAAVINQEETLNEWKKSTTTKHTCGGVSFGKKAPKGTCPRCDELHDGHAPAKWDHSKRDADIQRSKEIKAHDCKKSKCGPVCTFGDW